MSSIALARIHGPDDLRLDTVAPPVCGERDVVVKVRHCGICGSDLTYLTLGGVTGPGTPMPIGHELWGEVSEVGAAVRHVAVGDRVVVEPLTLQNYIGNGGTEGGFSPYLLVRNAADDPGSTLKIPDSVPDAFGPLVEPLSVAQHSANRVGATPSDRAVIFGAGPIGISLLLVLAYRGLENIAVVDLSDHRLAAARSLGAVALRGDDPQLPDRLRDAHGTRELFGMPFPATDIYFEATGVRAVFECILASAGPRSRVCLTGVHKEPATVDLTMLLAKEVAIIPAMGYDREFGEVMAMLSSGRLDPTPMISHHFPLSDIQAAFATARRPDEAIKVIVDCQA